ncbi:hypothetical protein CYY_010317 [Polysphondylium violaceum]|uniref:Transmembrane protein n=1 Tax=Polysphondylium violaceum TaxID=133409 RepID=A0A8J4UZV5_9MYCE|nr:hypothetical protein CYY_010317 [Polysphondylium violaceum]
MKANNNNNSNNSNYNNDIKSKLFESKYLLSGFMAGVISRTVTAPLERIKILNQIDSYLVNGSRYQNVWPALKTIVAEEGPRGLFRGNLVNVIKAGPQSAIRFYTYEGLKKMTQDETGHLSVANRMWAGASAGVVSIIMTHPLDIVKTRLSLGHPNQTRILETIKDIYKLEGLRGYTSGLSAAVLNIAPFSALNFTFYEAIKENTKKYIINDPPVYFSSLYGALSGSITMTILYPLDVVKRRLMLQRYYKDPNQHKNFIHCIYQIVKKEGIRALYKGLKPAYLKVIPTVSINFFCYELTLTLFK